MSSRAGLDVLEYKYISNPGSSSRLLLGNKSIKKKAHYVYLQNISYDSRIMNSPTHVPLQRITLMLIRAMQHTDLPHDDPRLTFRRRSYHFKTSINIRPHAMVTSCVHARKLFPSCMRSCVCFVSTRTRNQR